MQNIARKRVKEMSDFNPQLTQELKQKIPLRSWHTMQNLKNNWQLNSTLLLA